MPRKYKCFKSCAHVKPFSIEGKKSLLRIYETNLQDLKDHKDPNPESKAVKNTARLYGSNASTLRKNHKEQTSLWKSKRFALSKRHS